MLPGRLVQSATDCGQVGTTEPCEKRGMGVGVPHRPVYKEGRMTKYLVETRDRLIEHTAGCREDMHEPDNQGLTAIVSGYHLDNAMGDSPNNNCGELTVGLSYNDGHTYKWFNLATIIALARMAK